MNDSTNPSLSSRVSPSSAPGPAEVSNGAPDLRTRPLHEEVSACARELWRKYGCPVGRDEEIWLEAERQVLGADPKVARVDGGATSADSLNRSAISGSTASPGGEGRDPARGQTGRKELEMAGGSGSGTRSSKRRAAAR